MANHLRLSEKWFHRGLWLVAVLFAYFLIGLGGTIVGDLPKIEHRLSTDDFIDKDAKAKLSEALKQYEQAEVTAADELEQAKLKLQAARADYQAAAQAFNVWLKTRLATERPDQDKDLIARTTNLEKLKRTERESLSGVESLQKQRLDARQSKAKVSRELSALEDAADGRYQAVRQKIELRVFAYRLLFVLPLLLIAVYLFIRHRKKPYWPFVWGFIFFGLFAFFVELVPYLPNYGGYVRYSVGVIVTLIIGRYAIKALQNYIERQKAQEQQPELQRKKEIPYDLALGRINRKICPSCDRPIVKETDNFCQHCGIELFDRCDACDTRKVAFAKFCFHCGKRAEKAAA